MYGICYRVLILSLKKYHINAPTANYREFFAVLVFDDEAGVREDGNERGRTQPCQISHNRLPFQHGCVLQNLQVPAKQFHESATQVHTVELVARIR